MKKSLGLPVLVLLVLAVAAPPAAADAFGLDLGIHGGAVGTDGGNGSTFVGGAQARFHLSWLLTVAGRA